jgi:hypothetical protein
LRRSLRLQLLIYFKRLLLSSHQQSSAVGRYCIVEHSIIF